MKKFLKFTILFLAFFLVLNLLLEYSISLVINEKSNFKIESKPKYIVFGHSHPECAYNDALIDDFVNVGESGESYFYTYFKVKKVLEQNPSIKIIFLEFTNNQIMKEKDNWIWGKVSMSEGYPKYSSFMSFQEKAVLLRKRPMLFFNSYSISLNKRLIALFKKNHDYTKKIGGYYNYKANKIDSLLAVLPKLKAEPLTINQGVSEYNLKYLDKIINLCKEKGKKIILVRSPMHHKSSGYLNESKFMSLLKNRFQQVDFMDFSKFPLSDDEFADFEHLNYKGAEVFSTWLNSMFKKNILKKDNKQIFIDAEIKKNHESGN